MRKTHKKILGFLSLGLVAAMTIFAATLPIPGAKAATSTVTDVIRVTVIGSQVKVDIVEPQDNDVVFTSSTQDVTVESQHAKTVTVTGVYTDENGADTPLNIFTYNPANVSDTKTETLDLNTYGFGTYTITAVAEDESGITDEDIKTFTYIPAKADIDDSDEDGEIYVDLDYEDGVVCSADINVFLGGKLVAPPSPIHVTAPTRRVKIPVDNFATGDYTVVTTAYDCPPGPDEDPNPLPFPYTDTFHFEQEDIPVPDTGGLFMGLNISKTDYLLTAIIVFFAFATLALFIVIKGRKTNKRR